VRVRVISDLHGAVDLLRDAAGESDVLVVLGDLIDAVDHRSVGDEAEVRERLAALALDDYERVFEAMPHGTVVTYGNADIPELLRDLAPPGIRVVDGEVVELAGLRWGVVGGGLRIRPGVPGERSEAEHAEALASLGPVDVVGTHAPPRIPWYCYDTVAERFEPGSDALVAYIVEHRPRYALFGHVHQPLIDRGTIGPTELVNVGCLRARGDGWHYDGPD
jgi:Icc-related predicted phosphoesterase